MKDGTFLSQEKYAKNLTKKFGLEGAKIIKTPMSIVKKICTNTSRVAIEPIAFKRLYLIVSKLDLCFSVGVCARYQSSPKE